MSCNNHVSCVITNYRILNSFFSVHAKSFSSTCLSCVCWSTCDFEIFGYMTHMWFESLRMCMAELAWNRYMSHHTYESDGFYILFRNLYTCMASPWRLSGWWSRDNDASSRHTTGGFSFQIRSDHQKSCLHNSALHRRWYGNLYNTPAIVWAIRCLRHLPDRCLPSEVND